jgi:hypothetical protein
MATETYDHASKAEQDAESYRLEQVRTAGGHVADREQPSMPVVHRNFANPAPLGLLSFATGIFLISILGVHARGIQTPNILVGVIMFFGGVCQFIAGIMEFIAGNSFGATVFPSYAAFNFSYAMIYLPGTGILSAYTDSQTMVHSHSHLHLCSGEELVGAFLHTLLPGYRVAVACGRLYAVQQLNPHRGKLDGVHCRILQLYVYPSPSGD